MQIAIVLAASLLTSPIQQGPGISARVAAIDSEITASNLDDVGAWVTKQASSGARSIDLLINSPGGQVAAGRQFIARMHAAQAKGLNIRCFVYGQASSMAFWILTQCDARYALPGATVLFHKARVGNAGMLTAEGAALMSKELAFLDEAQWTALSEALSMSDKDIAWNWEAETDWTAPALEAASSGFFTSIDATYPGLFEALASPSLTHLAVPPNPLQFLFGGHDQVVPTPPLQPTKDVQ